MPRRTSGLGSGKVPVRALTGLLRELDPTTKNTLLSSFSDAESLLNFHSRSVPERQRRRRISGLVSKIALTGQSNLLGGFLEWQRLDDPRISMYEAQISDDDIFSNPETFTVLETFLALENLRTIKFARVRGVQANGTCGLWSNTVRISPRTSSPLVYSLDFYQRYFGAEPRLQKLLRYSGGLSHHDWDHPRFYQVFKGDFYVDRLVGALTAYGYICSRLKKYADGGTTPWDRVRFKVDGITRMDGYFPHWTSVPHASNFNENDYHRTTGEKMTFYMQGGYTAAFGPYAVTIPNTLNGLGPNDPHSTVQVDTVDGAFYWYDVNNARRASRYDEGQLTRYNDTLPAHEAHSDQIIEGGLTDWIVFRDFRMNVPTDATIFGIEAKVKRRQPNIRNDEISANFGVKRPDLASGFKTIPAGETDSNLALPDDFVLEHLATTGAGNANAEFSHIVEDIDFGRFLDLTCFKTGSLARTSARLSMDLTGVGNDGVLKGHDTTLIQTALWTGDEFTFSCWFRAPTPILAYHSGGGTSQQIINADAFNLFPNTKYGNSVIAGVSITCTTSAVSNTITNIRSVLNYANVTGFPPTGGFGTSTCSITPTGSFSQVNKWHHVVVTWSRKGAPPFSDGTHRMTLDGSTRINATTNVGWSCGAFHPFFMNMAVGTVPQGTAGANTGGSILSLAQVGVWDVALTAEEVVEIYEAKGRADYRHNFGDYASASQLNHYFLTFPERADIRDHQVCLVDENNTIRTDLDNKAADESWPQLSNFFYTDLRQFGFLPLAVSDGPTHDNHTAIGYQTYGGEVDQWGGSWTPQQINEFYFGIAVRATNRSSLGYRGDAFIDHAKLTVYTRPRFDRTVNMRVEVAVSNHFYLEREVFGGIMNLIELGEKLAVEED